MQNTPNYQGIGIPNYDQIISGLSEGQSLLGTYTSGGDIAKFFGFDKGYGKYFTPANISGIQEGLGQIPQLRDFMYNQNREGYNQNIGGLFEHIGKTNLAGTGSFDNQFDKINTEYSNKMFGADKQIQDLIQGYQSQLNQEISNMYGVAGNLLGSGARPGAGFGQEGWNEPPKEQNPGVAGYGGGYYPTNPYGG